MGDRESHSSREAHFFWKIGNICLNLPPENGILPERGNEDQKGIRWESGTVPAAV